LTEGLGKLLEELAGAGNSGVGGDKSTGNKDKLAATLAALAAQHGNGSRETGSDQTPPPEDIFAQLFAAAAGGSGSSTGGTPPTNKPSSRSADKSNERGSLSSDPQLTSFLDSLMHQLLSKEVLYQPMKDIAAKYPQWLIDNEDKLSDGDKERYTKQLQCITELIDIYENDPTNYPVLMDVLQTMQGCGNPPDDIVEELAPGMKFGGEGGGLGMGMGMGGIPSDLSSADCCIQ
jgi:peroxin-19